MSNWKEIEHTTEFMGTKITITFNYCEGQKSNHYDIPDDPDELEITKVEIANVDVSEIMEVYNETLEEIITNECL